MPWGLTRLQHSGQSHFVTFCCYHRRPLLTTDARRRIFESALERARHTFKLQVYGYVIMPEGGWPSLSVADAMIKRVPHSSRTLRRVGTMQLAVPFFDFPENLIIQAARTRPCKKRKDGAPFSYFVPKILKAGPPAQVLTFPDTPLSAGRIPRTLSPPVPEPPHLHVTNRGRNRPENQDGIGRPIGSGLQRRSAAKRWNEERIICFLVPRA